MRKAERDAFRRAEVALLDGITQSCAFGPEYAISAQQFASAWSVLHTGIVNHDAYVESEVD